MKKVCVAAALGVMVVMGFNPASAQMVDIGSGQMEQSEFLALKAMVQGPRTHAAAAISTPLGRQERYGMVEMTRMDFEALRDKVAGRSVSMDEKPSGIAAVQMVNIGTGEMPADEFIALKRMVEGAQIVTFEHLAALWP
ncbi:hypothetical protein [Desulfosarcina sp.]|uniref:hypothetical protein n=1 Tax=Desulfosarcina sp. TaxID=2027861 RepID=UPI003970FEB6